MSPVAVASRSFSRHPVLRREILARHPDVRFNDAGVSFDRTGLIQFLTGCDKAVIALDRITDDVLAALPDLKVIAKYGVGLDGLDLKAMARRGVRLGWTAGVNRRSVAELVVAAMIAVLRKVPAAVAETLGGGWRQVSGRQLTGRTVGIVGCGHVGKDLVELLQPFGCRLLAHDILDFPDFYARHKVRPVSLEILLAEAEIVTLHVPLDDSTRNLLSGERLRSMKPGAVLINFARGGLVDEETLKTLLQSGHLAGAAFDVFDPEPPTDRGLLALPTMLATPHIGGSSEEAILALGRAAIEGLDVNAVPGPHLGVIF